MRSRRTPRAAVHDRWCGRASLRTTLANRDPWSGADRDGRDVSGASMHLAVRSRADDRASVQTATPISGP